MVPVVDLSRCGRQLAPEFARAVADVVAKGSWLLGEQTATFEREFAAWLDPASTGQSLDVVAVSSGASALQLALAAAGVGPGDEVIVPAFTAVPTASAVCALGAIPVPVDVEDDTACLDPELVEAARTDRTKAVVVVYLYGRPATLPETDLPIIVDAAQAHGADVDPRRVAAIAYSFYPTKNLGGIGDGGAVVTADLGLGAEVRLRRVHGMTSSYVHEEISQNFRMSEIEAAWLRLRLPALSAGNERRRYIADFYRERAPRLVWQLPHPAHVHHLCVVRSDDRPQTRAALEHRGVATGVHYPRALTQQPAYRKFTVQPCPVAERWASQCISLPCFPELTDGEIEIVADALADIMVGSHG